MRRIFSVIEIHTDDMTFKKVQEIIRKVVVKLNCTKCRLVGSNSPFKVHYSAILLLLCLGLSYPGSEPLRL